jgi:beta-phosphoglucomutase-like phosphatase (HAD superfamily)
MEDDSMSETNAERSARQSKSKRAITRGQYDAVLLDLDGVITDTASVHAVCWKEMFDEYLQKRAAQRGEAFRPFDIASDCRLYVDGKPRYDGVRDFLTSRNIRLPQGSPDDSPQAETVDTASETARTTWSTKSSKRKGLSLTRGALNSSVSSAIENSKSPLSLRARTARLS